MIEINCHMCGESYAAHIMLGIDKVRMQPEECAKCGEDGGGAQGPGGRGGPAKPDPVPEYEDCKVECKLDRNHYMFTSDAGIRSIAGAPADPRFAGYVYTGKEGKHECCPALIFDGQTDGTWRMRVPLAVRLRKEVAQ
jgi:hypothetical protein